MSLISNLKLEKRNHKTVKASGSFTVGGVFDIKFALIESTKGMFVSLPRREYMDPKTNEKKWSNEVWCSDKDVLKELTDMAMDVYSKLDNPEPKTEVKTSAPSKKVPF